MTSWYLTLLLCLPLLDGGLRCAPRALAYPLPSPEACLRVGRQMVALRVQLPPGHLWLLPASPCSAARPEWPILPVPSEPERIA